MREIVAVVLGALLGTALRLGIDTVIAHADDSFPLSTLIINILGSFALGLLVARVWPTARSTTKAFLGPGLLGSFTTFSAVAVALVSLSAAGLFVTALLYLAVTLIGGFAAAFVGLTLGRRS